jgi:hypothetical protein
LDTFPATGAAIRVYENNVFVPQKSNFTDYLSGTGINTFPTGCTCPWICPYVFCADFTQSVHFFLHFTTVLLFEQIDI